MFDQLCRQHVRIDGRVPDEEGRPEASGECGLRLLHTLLGSGDLGGVARDEMVHNLVGCQLRDRGQDAEGIASEQNDLLRVMLHLGRDPGVRDILKRVRHARVLGNARVVVVHMACAVVEHHILKNGTEANRVVNFRLLVMREADGLRVAAALDVEDALRVPHVLVVADEVPLGVGTQGRLACSAEAEEDGDVVVLPDVRRGVQRQGAFRGRKVALGHQRHQVVHDSEYTLLHLTRILRAEDHHLSALEGDGNRGRRGHALSLAVAWEHTGVEDHEGLHLARLEVCELLLSGRHQHVLHEERMVGTGGDHADRYSVVLVPTAIAVHDVQALARVQVVDRPFSVGQEGLVLELDIHLAPPHVIGRRLLENDALVQRRTAGLLATLHCQGARGNDGAAVLVAKSLLIQDARRGVVEDLVDVQRQLVHLRHNVLPIDACRANLHGKRRLDLVRAPALEFRSAELLHELHLDLVLPSD
mmetsp:Transcript_83650/g.269599  ORF Transcript_83650/g.269599 Transcript_83650/m.269599 type:complete len:474 (+) Transcript_83650:729-2150(+)